MVTILVERIWPEIRKELKGVELHIYGAGHHKQLQARRKELEKIGVVFKGVMPDTQDLQRYRALLYPVQYTTGTKGAIVESWFQHTPVVTTPIGAEGLFLETS
jgi:O-antigen biosynthesis protein